MQKYFFIDKWGNETSLKMIYNKFTLAFEKDNERIYRKKYFHNSLIQFRVSFVLVTFLYGIFGFLDTLVAKEHESLFYLIRYGVVVPVLTIVFLLSFSKYFIQIWQQLLFVCFIVAGCGIAVMTLIDPENYSYYAGMMLIFSAGYFFIKLRFLLATIAGWLTLLFFNIGAIFFSNTDTLMIISNNFFFVSANLIGMFAAYYIEFYTRRDYYLNQQLDHRNTEIEDANRNLESKVAERTFELLMAKEQAEQSDKLKSAFLANMSHEIRTPMNGILGFAEILKEPKLTGEQQQEYIQIIERSGKRMLSIINDIVDISKIESGMMKVNLKESNINEQIEYIYTFFKPEAEAKGLKLFFKNSLPAKEAILITDREKVFAILTNLVKNAIKYTREGSIEFGYDLVETHNGASLRFYVKDTGIGIPKNRQKAIFDRFVQADIEDKEAKQGAGLGLAITKSYVEMLGGKIWVESEEKKGSIFYFTLPFGNEPSEKRIVPPEASVNQNDPEIPGLKILISDDDDISQMLISLMVKNYSKEILKAGTGLETIEICRNNPDIDLIFMDIRMPEMSGSEATRQIRQFNKEVVIIAQTAFGLSGDREKAIDAGCNDYIAKPVMQAELHALLRKYIYN